MWCAVFFLVSSTAQVSIHLFVVASLMRQAPSRSGGRGRTLWRRRSKWATYRVFFIFWSFFFRALEVGAGLVGGTIDVEPIGLETEWEDGSGVRASGSPTWPSAAPVAYCQGNSVRRLRPIYGGGRLGFIGLSPDAAAAAAGSLLVSKGEPVVVRLCVVFGVVTDWRGRFGCEEFSGVLLLLSSCLSPRLFGTGSVWGVEFSRDQSGGIGT